MQSLKCFATLINSKRRIQIKYYTKNKEELENALAVCTSEDTIVHSGKINHSVAIPRGITLSLNEPIEFKSTFTPIFDIDENDTSHNWFGNAKGD